MADPLITLAVDVGCQADPELGRQSGTVCRRARLADGTVWPIPITLAVDDTVKQTLNVGGKAALKHHDGTLLAVIDVEEVYPHDKALEIPNVFRTDDAAHPGVEAVLGEGDWLVAGPHRRHHGDAGAGARRAVHRASQASRRDPRRLRRARLEHRRRLPRRGTPSTALTSI